MSEGKKICVFGDIHSREWSYRFSRRNFIIRTHTGIQPVAFFKKFLQQAKPELGLKLKAEFPMVNTYVVGIAEDDYEYLSIIKKRLREIMQKELRFTGALFVNEESNLYQIYTGNLFLKFRDDLTQSQIKTLSKKFNFYPHKKMDFAPNSFFMKPLNDFGKDIFDVSLEILKLPEVEFCHPELVRKQAGGKRIPQQSRLQKSKLPWQFERVDLEKAWKYSRGKGSTIAIVDDGIQMDHPAFLNRIVKPANFYTGEKHNASHQFFDEGHGTSCAGVAASSHPDYPGIAPEAFIMPVRTFGLGTFQESEAIYYAAKNGADVISCSWGPIDSHPLSEEKTSTYTPLPAHTRLAIDYAVQKGRKGKGCMVVFSAGNGNERIFNDGYASYKNVLAVGSSNRKNRKSLYSDYGQALFCTFPGSDYRFDKENNAYETDLIPCAIRKIRKNTLEGEIGGTSASAAGVSGIIALMISANPELSHSDLKDMLKTSCFSPSGDNINPLHFGNGIINAGRATELTMKNQIKTHKIMNQAKSLHIGVNNVDPEYYGSSVPQLNGCINDMNSMKELALEFGYEPIAVLADQSATKANIRQGIEQAASLLRKGDIFLLSFAGHGSQIRDIDGDEKDNYDETWLTYDGFMLDDERHELFSRFSEGVRILVVSDSCHSGTSTRSLRLPSQIAGKARFVPAHISQQVLNRNNEPLQRSVFAELKASVKLLAACDDHQFAQETGGNGVFTTSLIKKIKGFSGNYAQLIKSIHENMPPDQSPQIFNTGIKNPAFDNQAPFDISPPKTISLLVSPEVSEPEVNTLSTDKLLIKVADFSKEKDPLNEDSPLQIKLKNEAHSINAWDNLVDADNFEGKTHWDKAYHAWFMMENSDEYVEPDIISRINVEGSKAAGSGSRHLSSYPKPKKNVYFWHLDKDHSRLKQAREWVYPEISSDGEPPAQAGQVRIAHIDTGVLPNHKIGLPLNFNKKLSRAFQDFWNDTSYEDTDINIGDTHGHGQGTISLLAGRKIEIHGPLGDFNDYFGAIPFADVVSLKISETVVNLSGHRFAKALKYAVDNKCDVVTMSMAGIPSRIMAAAVNYAYENGVIIVSAAGNSWVKGFKKVAPKKLLYPARFDRVIAAVGATYDHTPYLYALNNKKENRAAGGEFMQMNYGPQKAMNTAIAGYTPNVIWFDEDKDRPKSQYYLTTGGGTSSATPQIAAAAALYIQHYRKELDALTKNKAWEKVEIVREALWRSARTADPEYKKYFGRGLLDAREMLNHSPEKIYASGLKKSKAAKSSGRLLSKLINVYSNRSTGEKKETLGEMLNSEIFQLIHMDPDLEEFSGFDFETENELSEDQWNQLAEKIRNSEMASDFLKRNLKSTYRSSDCGKRATDTLAHHTNQKLEVEKFGNLSIVSPNVYCQASVVENAEIPEGIEAEDFCQIEIQVEDSFIPTRNVSNPELAVFPEQENVDNEMIILVSQTLESGEEIHQWILKDKNNQATRGFSSHLYGDNDSFSFGLKLIDENVEEGSRKLIKKAGKAILRLFKLKKVKKWARDKVEDLFDKLDDRKYEILVYDLEAEIEDRKESRKHWKQVQKNDPVWKSIKEQNKLLFVFPGLFGSVNQGYDDFLTDPRVVQSLKDTYSRYIVGYNMPDVFSSIAENGIRFLEMIPEDLTMEADVLARSRGSIVARQIFEVAAKGTELQKKLDKMIMCGPPNEGTPIANEENWKPLLDVVTNLAFKAFGNINPVARGLITLAKAILLEIPNLQGIEALSEGSKYLEELNNTTAKRSNYYTIVANFEPENLKAIFDEKIVDSKIFHGAKNDTVVPVSGALGDSLKNKLKIPEKQRMILRNEKEVHHFKYLRDEDVKKQLADWGFLINFPA